MCAKLKSNLYFCRGQNFSTALFHVFFVIFYSVSCSALCSAFCFVFMFQFITFVTIFAIYLPFLPTFTTIIFSQLLCRLWPWKIHLGLRCAIVRDTLTPESRCENTIVVVRVGNITFGIVRKLSISQRLSLLFLARALTSFYSKILLICPCWTENYKNNTHLVDKSESCR